MPEFMTWLTTEIIGWFVLGALMSFTAHLITTTLRLPFMLWRLARHAA